MSDDTEREQIINIREQQAAADWRLKRAEGDINAVAESNRKLDERVDKIDDKVSKFELTMKLYRGFLVGVVVILAWIVSNIDKLKGAFQ